MNCYDCFHEKVCKKLNFSNVYIQPTICNDFIDKKCVLKLPFKTTLKVYDELERVSMDAIIEEMKGMTSIIEVITLKLLDEEDEDNENG